MFIIFIVKIAAHYRKYRTRETIKPLLPVKFLITVSTWGYFFESLPHIF